MNFIKKHLCNSILFFILPVSIFLTLNKHSRSRPDSYKSVIWADAAGYYVYLPLTFIYGNDVNKFPENITERMGNGFTIDTSNNKLFNKYTCGVAIMQFPFFIASHATAKFLNKNPDGFSLLYQYGIMFAAVFYGCIGLWFLCNFLLLHFSPVISFLTSISIFLCTNLYYYTIDASGMSHVYSFFLCAAIMYFNNRFKLQRTLLNLFIISFLISLAVLIRPTNLLLALFPLFNNYKNFNDFIIKDSLFIKNRLHLILSFFVIIITFLPQFVYWYNLSGTPFYYSYGNEGFSNWNNPKLLRLWFSTNNGLFLYSPLILLSIVGAFYMAKKRMEYGIPITIIFIIISYLFASWHDWTFGCSYGSRPFIEYYPLLSIPLAFVFSSLKTKYQRAAVFAFVAFCCYLNFDMTYYYDGCFYGGDWDIRSYLKLLD